MLTNACLLHHLVTQAELSEEDVLFQMNSVVIEPPTDAIHTKDGSRLWVQAQILDFSGSVAVGVVEEAVPGLYGLASREQAEEKFAQAQLIASRCRMNCRGIVRRTGSATQVLIAATAPSALTMAPSNTAKVLASALWLFGPAGCGVVRLHAAEVVVSPLVGLCVRTSKGTVRAVKMAALLVRGTQKSRLATLETSTADMAYQVVSSNAQCLLSEDSATIKEDLVGYATKDDLLEYNLGTETAMLYVTGKSGNVLTVDRMRKVDSSDVKGVVAAMRAERSMALEEPSEDAPKRSAEDLVSPDNQKRCRSLHNYPTE